MNEHEWLEAVNVDPRELLDTVDRWRFEAVETFYSLESVPPPDYPAALGEDTYRLTLWCDAERTGIDCTPLREYRELLERRLRPIRQHTAAGTVTPVPPSLEVLEQSLVLALKAYDRILAVARALSQRNWQSRKAREARDDTPTPDDLAVVRAAIAEMGVTNPSRDAIAMHLRNTGRGMGNARLGKALEKIRQSVRPIRPRGTD